MYDFGVGLILGGLIGCIVGMALFALLRMVGTDGEDFE